VAIEPFKFEIVKHGPGVGRAGVMHTPHGSFNTPAFCTVGTKGTVKAILPKDLRNIIGAEVALANTYHLFLQPGDEVVQAAGGLHKFMGWDGPLVTDSGGFQVFSLGAGFGKKVSKFGKEEVGADSLSSTGGHRGNGSENEPAPTSAAAPAVWDADVASQHGKLAIVDEEGVSFTSHIDGTLYRFTPERSVEIQHRLGADIFFAFDECTSPEAPREYQKEAMDRTHRWAERSLTTHRGNLDARKKQAIFGIVQGGRYPDLRAESAKEIGSMGFDGFGIGGSFSKADLGEALVAAINPLPNDKPRHLLGIGEPEDLFEGIANGIDMFDCVLPTRLGRTGTIFTKRGKVDVRKAEHAQNFTPFSEIPELQDYTYAYLNHLFRAGEMLAPILASMHNLHFIVSLVKDIRQSILDDRFDQFRTEFLSEYRGH
jgi:queuine tRNA-ribosyltransferase